MKNALVSGLVFLASASALADQCAYVEKSQATAALRIALETSTIEALCEPCGETVPVTLQVTSIGIEDAQFQDFWKLMINGKNADLAYTYVNGLNLAKLVSCPATGVRSSL